MVPTKKRTLVAIVVVLGLAVCIAVKRLAVRTTIQFDSEATVYQYLPIARTWSNSSAEPPPSLSCYSKKVTALTKEEISGIEKFVIFVGYARSGTSIIGSLMDAHPNMIIAHEYMIFKTWPLDDKNHDTLNGNRSYLFNELYQNSYRASCLGARTEHKDNKGYTLFVNNSWQAHFKDLKVIGDKSGGKAGSHYSRDALNVQNSYQEIMETVKVPIRSLHLLRNPFDIISTSLLYKLSDVQGRKYEPMKGTKCNSKILLDDKIDTFFVLAKAVRNMISTCKLTVLEIHSEDFVKQPQESMKRICDFLGVECSPWYLQMCQDKVFPSVSRSRDKVEWTEEQIARVQNIMNTFPYFKGYNFIRDNYDHS